MQPSVLFQGPEMASHLLQVNIMFNEDLHRQGSRHGSFVVWKKQGSLGAADEVMFFCPTMGCTGLMDPDSALTDDEMELVKDSLGEPTSWPPHIRKKCVEWVQEKVTCPACGVVTPRAELADSYGFSMPVQMVAERMVELFTRLNRNADILMVINKNRMALLDAKGNLHSSDFDVEKYKKQLDSARDRAYVRYPLERILRDTSAGSDLNKRFEALLRA